MGSFGRKTSCKGTFKLTGYEEIKVSIEKCHLLRGRRKED
jgi:hypothetical protein